MSKYTTEVRYICENYAGYNSSQDYESVDEIIAKAVPKIFNFPFPVFDDKYKPVLCAKILKHYYTREIGEETVGLWKLRLETRLNEIMPYYNKLYESELIEFNPLHDVNLTTTHDGNKKENSDRSGTEKTGFGEHKTSQIIGTETSKNTANSTENVQEDSTNNRTINEDETVTENTITNVTQKEDSTVAETSGGTREKTANRTRDVLDGATTQTTENSTSSTSSQNSENDGSKDLFSDTPQGAITDLETESYLTNARIISGTKTGQGTNSGENNSTSNTTYNDTIKETIADTESETSTGNRNVTNGLTGTNKTTDDKDIIRDKDVKDNTIFSKTGTVTGDSTENGTNNSEQNATHETSSEGNKNTQEYANMTGMDHYIETLIGKSAGTSYSKLLQEFRETFINIDKMIIDELADLFMLLW